MGCHLPCSSWLPGVQTPRSWPLLSGWNNTYSFHGYMSCSVYCYVCGVFRSIYCVDDFFLIFVIVLLNVSPQSQDIRKPIDTFQKGLIGVKKYIIIIIITKNLYKCTHKSVECRNRNSRITTVNSNNRSPHKQSTPHLVH